MNNNKVGAIRAWLRCWSITANLKALNQHDSGTFYLINGLRFFGFLWILVAHTVFAYGIFNGKEIFFEMLDNAPFYVWWIWGSDKAVDLFFVLSGFLISLILIKELDKTGSIKLRRFYFRRYLRLTPVYAFIAFLFWSAGAKNHEYIWTNLLYINNFLPPDKMPLQWTWTLAVEEQFYLLLPLLLLYIQRSLKHSFMAMMMGLLGLSLLIRFGVLFYYDELWFSSYREMLTEPQASTIFYAKLYDNLVTRYGPFVLGVMAGYGYYYHRQTIIDWVRATPYRALNLNVLAMSMIVFFMYFPIMADSFQQSSAGLRAYIVFHRTIFSAAFTWFILSVFLNFNHFTVFSWFYSLRIWHPLGQLSYSMYLTHFIVILVVMKQCNQFYHNLGLTSMDHFLVTVTVGAFVSLLLTLLVGIFCWVFIEKPFLNMRDLMSVNRGATKAAPIAVD